MKKNSARGFELGQGSESEKKTDQSAEVSSANAQDNQERYSNEEERDVLPIAYPATGFKRDLIGSLFGSLFMTSLSAIRIFNHLGATPRKYLLSIFKIEFLRAYGFDGFDHASGMISSADGKTKPYLSDKLPFWLILASFLGLPSRPERVVNGAPEFSGWQLLRNFLGVWVPIKETWGSPDSPHRFYQYRWTEKKIVQGLLLFFKITLILPIKIILMPFKIMLNLLKLLTEVLIPVASDYTAVFNAQLENWLLGSNFSLSGAIYSLFSNMEDNWGRFILELIVFILLAIPVLAVATLQYAMVWACRIGLALTSPAKSARLAFVRGYHLRIGEKGSWLQIITSNLMGGLGVILSLGLSAILWTFALPLALGALTTLIPSLLNAINWISQLSWVSTSLTWLSQWPSLINLGYILNTMVSTVGTGLGMAFGSAITTIASAMSIQIPAAVMTVGTFLGMIAVPIGGILSLGADALSNRWANWIEQRPFAAFARWGSSLFHGESQKEGDEVLNSLLKSQSALEELMELVEPEEEPGYCRIGGIGELIVDNDLLYRLLASQAILERFKAKAGMPKSLYVYQAEEGGELIVSAKTASLKDKNDNLIKVIEVTGDQAEALYLRALDNKVNHSKDTGVRFPTMEEPNSCMPG